MNSSGRQICRAIFEEICVLANGEVVCSCGDPAGFQVYGNIKDSSIAEIFGSPKYRAMRRYQLRSKPSSYCPVIKANCGGRVYASTPLHSEEGLAIKRLQLEPISRCNLDCPECPVHNFQIDAHYRANRQARLSLEEMLHIVEQLPALELILYFNFGEPFLHTDSVSFFRGAKALRPKAQIHTSTNVIPLTARTIEAIAQERLLDNITCSIDGASQASYGQYRRGGEFKRAFGNMVALREAIRKYNTEKEVKLFWQYILFEWNDSDAEIARAKQLSREYDIPIMWILTHTHGKSTRYSYDSKAYKDLIGESDGYEHLTCELQEVDIRSKGIKGKVYAAEFKAGQKFLGNRRFSMELTVRNASESAWVFHHHRPYCVGIKFLGMQAETLHECVACVLYDGLEKGETVIIPIDVTIPELESLSHVLIDILHANVCWFHDRGASPLIIPVEDLQRNEAVGSLII